MSTALRSITGWKPCKYSSEFEDPLAYNKFVVFALVSSLLIPNAAKLFRQTLQQERFYKRSQRLAQRDRRNKKRFDRRTDKLVSALLESLRPEEHKGGFVFPPPCWHGEPRPHGARAVRLRSNFPSAGYLARLVSEFGYEGSAAIAALSRAHEPWTRVSDRRRANGGPDFNADAQINRPVHEHSSFSPGHPYFPMSPSRRTKVGGGLTKEQVEKGLEKMRTDERTKKALLEIVYRRRSTLQVADEFDRPVETLYRYATRLRGHIRKADATADLNV
jgi:hypothetical protein